MLKKKTLTSIVAVLVVLGYWVLENVDFGKSKEGLGESNVTTVQESAKVGAYERLAGCTLIDHRNNDGDSFHVSHAGNDYEFRLYFVDTPESKYKTYGGGEDNGKRIADQGRYFGGLDQNQTTGIGTEGKKLTLGLLGSRPFTVYTKWQPVFNSGRFFCMVKVEDAAGRERFLSEVLVEEGLVRIYTEGADMPDGTTTPKQKDKLRALERLAKESGTGGWRFAGK